MHLLLEMNCLESVYWLEDLLVSTHVVCERLSVMHYTLQLVQFFIQISLSVPTQVFQECWSLVWSPPHPPPPPPTNTRK